MKKGNLGAHDTARLKPRFEEEVPIAKFSLDSGESRLGWILDGNPATPSHQAVLENTGEEIRLRFSWEVTGSGQAGARQWFSGALASGNGDDSNHELPGVLWFEDGDGVATLVGVRDSGVATNFRVSEGSASVRYAVLDTSGASYGTVHGFRSEVDGLLEWFEQRSLTVSRELGEQGRLVSMTLRLAAPEPTRLGRVLNLQLRPHFSTSTLPNGDVVIHETALIETVVSKPRPIGSHVIVHDLVRDLVAVSMWRLPADRAQWAMRTDDPLTSISGKKFGPRWAEVRTHSSRANAGDTQRGHYMFRFSNVGVQGFTRWHRVRDHFARGVDPLLATLDPRNAGLEASLALSAIGLDGIGYRLALDSGLSKRRAESESHRARFQRVAADVIVDLPWDVDEWSRRAADASNGIKHANRDMPEVLTMANTLRENCLVFRLWVASRIGVSRREIQRSVAADPMARPFVMRE